MMKETIHIVFGEARHPEWYQMCARGIVIFAVTLVLIRISGRRSFGMKMPIDNIIAVLIGALLSRPIVGASDFVPVVAASTVLVLLHRSLAWVAIHSPAASKLLKGDKICLYRDGRFQEQNMTRALVCREDIMNGVRQATMAEDMEQISAVYMERNGAISVIKETKPCRQ